jgi:hypothetical protein
VNVRYKVECILCGKLLGWGSIDPRGPGKKSTGYCVPCYQKSRQLLVNVKSKKNIYV